MSEIEFPKITSIEVIAIRPESADQRKIAYIRSNENVQLDDVAYLVKINFETMPPVGGMGLALCLDDYRVSKYWSFDSGIFFKVYNPRFFFKHGGKQVRFCLAGDRYHDTGFRLPAADSDTDAARESLMASFAARPASLPSQAEALRDSG